MKGFEKGMSPSKSNANRNLTSSGLVENNENDSNVDKLIPQFENHKITHRKNLMSGAPRKKILAEINEDPSASDAQCHKNSNLETGKSGKKKGVSDSAFEPKDDSSVKVYDPLTNYLSPRPQYLRFNPNRRREILKRLDKELSSSLDSEEASDEGEWSAEEIADSFYLSPPKGSAVNQRNGGIFEEDNGNGFDVYVVEVETEEVIEEFGVSPLSPPKGSSVNQRDGGIFGEDNGDVVDGDEAEEEEEEGETEERGWCLRGILKLLLTLIACLLSTSYICSMNSPSNSQTEQAIWNSKDSGLVIKNETLEFVGMQLQDHGFFEVEDGGDNRIKEVEVNKEKYGEFDGSTEAAIVENLEWKEKEIVDEPAEFVSTQLQDHGFFEVEDESNNSFEEVEVDKENYEEFDESIEEEIIEYLEWKEKEMTGGNYIIDEVEVDKENYDEFDGSIEAQIVEYLEWKENEDSEDLVDEAAEAAQVELKTDEFEHSIDAETDENLDGGIVLDTEVVSTYMTLDEDDNVNEDEAAETEIMGGVVDSEELVGSQGDSNDSIHEVDELGDDSEKSEWNISTLTGFSAVVTILTSLAIIYHSKKSRRNTSSEKSEPLLKQKLAVEENVNSVLPSIDRKVEFLARAPLSSHSMREALRELPIHINPPTVELISEIVLGQPSSSRRNSGKFQTTISEEECNATLSQKRGSLPRLVPAPSQPSVIEHHPSASSSSCGSLTTVIKMSKKQGGRSREAMTETTSVRRSTRLRNRAAVMSP